MICAPRFDGSRGSWRTIRVAQNYYSGVCLIEPNNRHRATHLLSLPKYLMNGQYTTFEHSIYLKCTISLYIIASAFQRCKIQTTDARHHVPALVPLLANASIELGASWHLGVSMPSAHPRGHHTLAVDMLSLRFAFQVGNEPNACTT